MASTGLEQTEVPLRLSEARKTRDLGKDMSRIIREAKQPDIADIMKVMEATFYIKCAIKMKNFCEICIR